MQSVTEMKAKLTKELAQAKEKNKENKKWELA